MMIFRHSKRILVSLALGAIVLSLPAKVGMAQYVERKKVDVDVEEVRRKKSDENQKNQLNRSAIFAIEVEKKLIEGIDKTLAFYQKQYKRMSPGSESRLNIMMRLLDLNLEQASYTRNEEERAYDKRWTAWDLNGRSGAEPKLNTAKSYKHWRQVITHADLVMREYPKNKDADKVIFTKAFALSYLGQEKEAAKIYTQLIQTYPNSPVAGDAYSSLGDFYFERNDFRNALNNFTSALRYKQSQRYLWAMFKIGWCNYNLGKNADALRAWKELVRIAKSQGEQGLRLRDEALRDMVYAFAETKDVEGAIAYYRANGGGEYIGSLLTLLAQELADDGNYPEAIKTFRLLQKLIPTNPQAPAAQKELVLLTYELNKLPQMWQELLILHKLYGEDGRWAQGNANDKKLVLETKKMAKDQILYYAKVLHKRAQKQNNEELHKQAKIGYEIFLKEYPRSREVIEVKYYLADIEFFLKDYRSAGQQYLEIAMRGKKDAVIYDANTNKPTNVHKDASVYMVDAYARDFQGEFKAMQKGKPDFDKPPRPLTARAKNYIRACSLYMKDYPEDAKLRKVCEVDIARIYYQQNDKEQARKYLWVIANKYSKAKEGTEAVEFLIPMFADDKKKLLDIADNLLKIPEYQKGELGEKLRALKSGAAKEAVEKEKDPLARAKQYETLAKKNPKDPEADILLYKAGDNYLQGGDAPSAISAYLLIIDRYPKSERAKTATLDVAQLYEKRLDFATAAAYFDRYAKAYPKDPKAKDGQGKSCDLLIAIDSNKAAGNCLEYARKYPAQAEDIVNRLILSAERDRRFGEMATLIRREYLPRFQLSANQRIIALNRIYKVDDGRGAEPQRASQEMLAEFQRSGGKADGEALRYVAGILFRRANAGMTKYGDLKLVGGTVERLGPSIERKGAELLALKKGYDSVLQTRDSYWGVATLHQIGIAHEQFAMMLANPPEIQGAKIEDVKAQLAPQVEAVKKEAQNFYQEAYKLVQQFKVYNEWSVKVITAFYRVTGASLSFDDWIIEPDFVASEVSTSLSSSLKPGKGD